MLHCDENMVLNSSVDCKMNQKVLTLGKPMGVGRIGVTCYEAFSLYFLSRTPNIITISITTFFKPIGCPFFGLY